MTLLSASPNDPRIVRQQFAAEVGTAQYYNRFSAAPSPTSKDLLLSQQQSRIPQYLPPGGGNSLKSSPLYVQTNSSRTLSINPGLALPPSNNFINQMYNSSSYLNPPPPTMMMPLPSTGAGAMVANSIMPSIQTPTFAAGAEETQQFIAPFDRTSVDDGEFFDICYVFALDETNSSPLSTEEVHRMWSDDVCCPSGSLMGNFTHNGDTEEERYSQTKHFYQLRKDEVRAMPRGMFNKCVFDKFVTMLKTKLGCTVDVFPSVDRKYTCVMARMHETNLAITADRVSYPLQFDRLVSKRLCYRQDKNFVAPYKGFRLDIETGNFGLNCMRTLGRVWARYDENGEKWKRSVLPRDRALSLFRKIDRVRLLDTAVKSVFNTLKMQKSGLMTSQFVLHSERQRKPLQDNWGRLGAIWTTSQPIERIRKYFGEGVALYFDFIGMYTRSLYLMAILGVCVGCARIYWDPYLEYKNKWLDLARIGLSIYISVWCTWLCQAWDRKEYLHSLRWGTNEMDQFRSLVQERQAFKMEKWIQDPVRPNRMIKWYPRSKQHLRWIIAGFVSAVCIIFCVLASNEKFHKYLMRYSGADATIKYWASNSLPSTMNAQVTKESHPAITAGIVYGFQQLFNFLSTRLTDFENLQYEDEYQNSLVMKLFSFTSVDYFTPLFYMAFIKMYVDPCWEEDSLEGRCLRSLQSQIFWICVMSFGSNLTELLYPFAVAMLRRYKHLYQKVDKRGEGNNIEETTAELSSVEMELYKSPYDDTTDDFHSMFLELLLIAFFSTAFPLLPLVGIVLNHVEIRVDAVKLCSIMQRPYPVPAQGIGAWRSVLKSICWVAIIVNIGLCAFTTFGKKLSTAGKLLLCVVAMLTAFVVKEILEQAYPSISPRAEVLERQQELVLYEALWGAGEREEKAFLPLESEIKADSEALYTLGRVDDSIRYTSKREKNSKKRSSRK